MQSEEGKRGQEELVHVQTAHDGMLAMDRGTEKVDLMEDPVQDENPEKGGGDEREKEKYPPDEWTQCDLPYCQDPDKGEWADKCAATFEDRKCVGCEDCAGHNSRAFYMSTRGHCSEDSIDEHTFLKQEDDKDVQIDFTANFWGANKLSMVRMEKEMGAGHMMIAFKRQTGENFAKLMFNVFGNAPNEGVEFSKHFDHRGKDYNIRIVYSQANKQVTLLDGETEEEEVCILVVP